jgi:hypothetical protein
MFVAATRSSLLRSSTLVQSVYMQKCSASSIASSVKSLEGVHFMSIDQLRYSTYVFMFVDCSDFGVLELLRFRASQVQSWGPYSPTLDDAVCSSSDA